MAVIEPKRWLVGAYESPNRFRRSTASQCRPVVEFERPRDSQGDEAVGGSNDNQDGPEFCPKADSVRRQQRQSAANRVRLGSLLVELTTSVSVVATDPAIGSTICWNWFWKAVAKKYWKDTSNNFDGDNGRSQWRSVCCGTAISTVVGTPVEVVPTAKIMAAHQRGLWYEPPLQGGIPGERDNCRHQCYSRMIAGVAGCRSTVTTRPAVVCRRRTVGWKNPTTLGRWGRGDLVILSRASTLMHIICDWKMKHTKVNKGIHTLHCPKIVINCK